MPDLFLTAYDPTDLPSGSVDPLGFAVGYLALADEFLPGLTGAASVPRYFSVLCAGVLLADKLVRNIDSLSPRQRRAERVDCGMRFERAWALASMLAAIGQSDTEGLPPLRGITYVQREVERIERDRRRKATTHYPLLSRQYTYGMMGIYGSAAVELRLVDKPDFALTPSLGRPLAEAFLDATLADPAERRAIERLTSSDEVSIPIDALRTWGSRASALQSLTQAESTLIRDGVLADRRRAAAFGVLQEAFTALEPDCDELELLSACRRIARKRARHGDSGEVTRIATALDAIVRFELAYRWVMVAFERLLRVTRQAGDVVARSLIDEDIVLGRVGDELIPAAMSLEAVQGPLVEAGMHTTAARVREVAEFVSALAKASSTATLIDEVLERHRRVQAGKLERGRRKLPWIESRQSTLAITSTRAGGQNRDVQSPGEVPLHIWRTYSARALLFQMGGAA